MSMKCPHCSEKILPTDVFCPFCGRNTKEVPLSPPAFSAGAVSCTNCGSLNHSGVQFCANCGVDLLSSTFQSSSSASSSSTTSHTYGAATDTSPPKQPWYKPPHRTRSAKHPIEWFFWFGWSLYIILRVVFFILLIGVQIFGRRR